MLSKGASGVMARLAKLAEKRWGGFTFKIDRPKGFVKKWDQPDGSIKEYTYPVDYGYFVGHVGEDDEGLDAFVGSDPEGPIESFLKLKPDPKGGGKMVPDETKFLIGLTPAERKAVLKLYKDGELIDHTEYDDVYDLMETLTEFRTAKKVASRWVGAAHGKYLEQGGVYGSLEFSRLLGYSEEQIALYKELLELQAKLNLPPWGYRRASEERKPLSPTYLQNLIKKSLEVEPALDISYGMGRTKGAPLLQKMLKKMQQEEWQPIEYNDEVLPYLESRYVPEDELVELRKVPEPRKAPAPSWNEKRWQWFQEVTGKPTSYKGEYNPAYNRSILEWGKAFETIKAKYPQPWRIYLNRVKAVQVGDRGVGTEEGSWMSWANGGTLFLRLRESEGKFGLGGKVGILLHEIGHVYEENFNILELMGLNLYGMGHPPFVSDYAGKNVSEDFAETFLYYWRNRSYLKSKAPMKYEDMHDRLMGKKASASRVAARYLAAAEGKYKDIDFQPPKAVADEAEKGLKLREKASPSNRGGLTSQEAGKQGIGSGVQRAVNLKNRDNVTPETIGKMLGFFARHEKNKGIPPEHKDEPWNAKGYVAWLLWGGDAGRAWAKKVKDQMDKADAEGKTASVQKVAQRYLAAAAAVGRHSSTGRATDS